MIKLFRSVISSVFNSKNKKDKLKDESNECKRSEYQHHRAQNEADITFAASLNDEADRNETNMVEFKHQVVQSETDNIFEDSLIDESDPHEDNYEVFSDLVKGTRYEKYAGKTTSLWAFDSLLCDSSCGKKRIKAKYHEDFDDQDELGNDNTIVEAYLDNRRFEIDAYYINSKDFAILNRVLEVANVEIQEPEEFERTRFEFMIYKEEKDVSFHECYHPHYSSYNTVKGNMYDDNIDTNGSSLGIMAVRSHLLFNTDTKEFVIADGRYWCL
ncbi:hypothetical protein [Paenibacillus sp. FSL L8-0709]|uniref:hypothetical protein n=1 Tax=Paenibacillus sp. FSL L8-0709 TaxID=2975312 RepID=UPI0030FBAAA6